MYAVMFNLVPRALFPAREKRPGDEVAVMLSPRTAREKRPGDEVAVMLSPRTDYSFVMISL